MRAGDQTKSWTAILFARTLADAKGEEIKRYALDEPVDQDENDEQRTYKKEKCKIGIQAKTTSNVAPCPLVKKPLSHPKPILFIRSLPIFLCP